MSQKLGRAGRDRGGLPRQPAGSTACSRGEVGLLRPDLGRRDRFGRFLKADVPSDHIDSRDCAQLWTLAKAPP
jgi:hypothetical protein